MTVDEKSINPGHPDTALSVKSEIKEIDDTTCNFPSCGKQKWSPYDFCGNTHAMMAGDDVEEIGDGDEKEKGTSDDEPVVPDMNGDNLESCMTKTQELIQDTINNLFSTTE